MQKKYAEKKLLFRTYKCVRDEICDLYCFGFLPQSRSNSVLCGIVAGSLITDDKTIYIIDYI